MAFDKRTRERLLAHCEEIHGDDGIDPREFFKTGRTHQKEDRKAKQLCRQVAETLDQVFAGEANDDLLRSLRVVDVAPAPDSSRLLVTLYANCDPERFDLSELEVRLDRFKGKLRCDIAAAITRRRAPTLSFNIVRPNSSSGLTSEGGHQ